VRSELEEVPVSAMGVAAYGVIALAEVRVLEIAGNLLVENGQGHLAPICGVFVLGAASATIASNQIFANATRSASTAEPAPGIRGGIVVMSCEAFEPGAQKLFRAASLHAARVIDNVVVWSEGRALALCAAGDVVVARNRFVSEGMRRAAIAASTGTDATTAWDRLERAGGAAVVILGPGNGAPLELGMGTNSLSHLAVPAAPARPVMPVRAPLPVMKARYQQVEQQLQ
jgi:hypothetical protein